MSTPHFLTAEEIAATLDKEVIRLRGENTKLLGVANAMADFIEAVVRLAKVESQQSQDVLDDIKLAVTTFRAAYPKEPKP